MAKGMWVVLNVENPEKSLEFYRGLGLRAKFETDGPFRWGTVTVGAESGLVLWPKNVLGPNQPPDTMAWLTGELGKGVVLTIGVPNAEKVWARVQEMRYPVDQPLTTPDWGGKEFQVVDPDGFVINVADKFPGAPAKKPARKTGARKGAAARRPARKAKPATRGAKKKR